MDPQKAEIVFPGSKKDICRQLGTVPQDDKNKWSMDDRMRVGHNNAGRVDDKARGHAVISDRLRRGGGHDPGEFRPDGHNGFFCLLDTVDQAAVCLGVRGNE